MGKLWLLLGGVALAEYVLIALDFVRPHPPEGRSENAGIFVAGPTDRFRSKGTVTAFPAGKFYLARLEDGGFPRPIALVHAPRVARFPGTPTRSVSCVRVTHRRSP